VHKPTVYIAFLSIVVAFFYMAGLVLFVISLPHKGVPLTVDGTDGLAIFTGGSKRIEVAVDMLANGYEKPVLISGVNPQVSKEALVGHLPLASQALVTVDYDSLSTRENVVATKNWAQKHHMNSVSLITSFYHVPRSLLYWGREAQSMQVNPYPVFPEEMPLLFMLREYHKYILTSFYII
jgi:uncharacterized SAM-binding protein YcdF (DUF218 family)